jgi:hypothetical protein
MSTPKLEHRPATDVLELSADRCSVLEPLQASSFIQITADGAVLEGRQGRVLGQKGCHLHDAGGVFPPQPGAVVKPYMPAVLQQQCQVPEAVFSWLFLPEKPPVWFLLSGAM